MSAVATAENKTASATGRSIEYVTPVVNLRQDAEGYVLDVEMPGVGKEGVQITVDDGRLTLVGHRRASDQPGRSVYSERGTASYRRIFDLDPTIDTGKITASIDQGLLVVHLPKAEAAKPRKVTVS